MAARGAPEGTLSLSFFSMTDAASPTATQPLQTPGFVERESLPKEELLRSSRGRDVARFARGIPSDTPHDDPKRGIADTALLSVREKSSIQFRQTFGDSDQPPPERNSDGRFATRSALLAARKKETIEANAAVGANAKSTLPIGNQPGAPGKNPEYKRFTHHDVERMIGKPPK